jgi:hypothetical protein
MGRLFETESVRVIANIEVTAEIAQKIGEPCLGN